MEAEYTTRCFVCGKTISQDEYAVCWGYCRECLDADYSEYLRTHPEATASDERHKINYEKQN